MDPINYTRRETRFLAKIIPGIRVGIVLFFLNNPILYAQDTLHISMGKAIQMGLDTSQPLKLSEARVQEAEAQYRQVKDEQLPQVKASYMASKAYIPTRKLQIEGLMKQPVELPSNSMIYLGTFSVNEAIFAGNKMRYAKQSAALLQKIATLDAAQDKDEITFAIIQSYINLYKIDENLKIIKENLADIDGRLKETIQFEHQGLATENDVLRFKLEKANVMLTQIDLQNNRAVANFNMDILLGLPDHTVLTVDSIPGHADVPSLDQLLQKGLENRKDLAAYKYKKQLSEVSIKNIKAEKLPTLGAGLTAYYLNPTQRFFPSENSYLVPVTLGLNLSWDISSLYTARHKISEAHIKLNEMAFSANSISDQVRTTINKNYRAYLQALQKVEVLETAVDQAQENDRVMELKYRNQLATTTDRIDAQTMLYQSLVNLELAKADVSIAYFQLRESTGTLTTTNHF